MDNKNIRSPNILNQEEQNKLLSVFNERYPTSLRNKTMVRLMLKTGLKLSETIKLKWDDINFSDAKLTLSQNENDRNLWLGDKTLNQIKKWEKRQIDVFERKNVNNEGNIVFTTLTGNQMNKSNVRKMVYNYAEKAGIQEERVKYYKDEEGNKLDKTYKEKKVNPHTLRHTFAVELYNITNDIKMVQKALGHNNIQSTMIYANLSEKKLKNKLKLLDK